jgi:glycosyltransferase involved in cell wall biosynthesis
MVNKKLISIVIPTYNGQDTIQETLDSVFSQNYDNFEIIISDDNSSDNTISIIKSFNSPKIKIYSNAKNLGYPGNMRKCVTLASADYLMLLGQDDLVAKNVFSHYVNLFEENPDVGAIARPYYAFDLDKEKPIRFKRMIKHQVNPIKVSINDSFENIHNVFNTLDQLSGLAFRKAFLNTDFHEDVFPCHVYPFLGLMLIHPIIFTNRYTIAVRVNSSQCIKVSNIYNKSPVMSWIELFENLIKEQRLLPLRDYMIKNFVCSNWIGLLQIKNYSKNPYSYLFREASLMLRYNQKLIFDIRFLLVFLLCVITPRIILVPFVNWTKEYLSAMLVPNFEFEGVNFDIKKSFFRGLPRLKG